MNSWIFELKLGEISHRLDQTRLASSSQGEADDSYSAALVEAAKDIAMRIEKSIVEPLRSEASLVREDMNSRQKRFLAKMPRRMALADIAEGIAQEFRDIEAMRQNEDYECEDYIEMFDAKLQELYNFGDYGAPYLKLCWIDLYS